MKHISCLALVFIAFSCNVSHAQDVYAGAALSSSYSSSLNFADAGKQYDFKSKDKAIPLKFFIGCDFNQNLAAEVGYKTFGKTTVDPVPGSGSTLGSSVHALYVAAKASKSLSEDWSLFGKLGVTYNTASFTGTGELRELSGSGSKANLYAGLGVAYKLSKDFSLTLELERFGSATQKDMKFKMDGLSAGVHYQF